MEVIVKNIIKEADDIISLELVNENNQDLVPFTAGSHIDVHLSNGLIRQYSLCNSPSEVHRYVVGILNDPNSRGGSKFIHETLKVGDTLQISEPRNLFPLVENAKKSIFIAGGIGITPILSMAKKLSQDHQDFDFHYCSRSLNKAAFLEEMKNSTFSKNTNFYFDDGAPETKFNIENILGNPDSDTHLYVCGPSGFLHFVLETAEKFGWSDKNVHREYFSAAPQSDAVDNAFDIEIKSSGEILHVPANKKVIDVLMEHDIDIPISCEQGVCGTCVTGVLSGIPDHRDMFLTNEERDQNDQFTPCCSRSNSRLLVLDL